MSGLIANYTYSRTIDMAVLNPHNNFRQRLLSGECMIGTFANTPSMMISEVLAHSPLDVVCIDAEHSPFDRSDIDRCLLAYREAQMPALVRVPSSSPEQILNALDCGATGVLVPHIDSPEKAKECAVAAKYGSAGRGYAGSTRSAGYGDASIDENIRINHSETTVIIQIEDIASNNFEVTATTSYTTNKTLEMNVFQSFNNTTTQNCVYYTSVYKIDVVDRPTISVTGGSSSQEVCDGTAITPIPITWTGSSSILIIDLDAGLSVNVGAGAETTVAGNKLIT